MQAGGAAQGAGVTPGRKRLEVLLATAAVLVAAAVVALVVWVVPLTTSGVGAEDAAHKAGASTAVLHDDAGNVDHNSYPLSPEKAASLNVPNAVSAVVHDDAGNMPLGAGSAVMHDDAGNLKLR